MTGDRTMLGAAALVIVGLAVAGWADGSIPTPLVAMVRVLAYLLAALCLLYVACRCWLAVAGRGR